MNGRTTITLVILRFFSVFTIFIISRYFVALFVFESFFVFNLVYFGGCLDVFMNWTLEDWCSKVSSYFINDGQQQPSQLCFYKNVTNNLLMIPQDLVMAANFRLDKELNS